MDDIEIQLLRARDLLRESRRVVVFTGAGISLESGISTFRDEGGLWTKYPPSQFANWSRILTLLAIDAKLLAEFSIAVLKPIANASPNVGHQVIADLENHIDISAVITQNIDGLHKDSGSSNVVEMHGNAFEILCRDTISLITRDQLHQAVSDLELLCSNPSVSASSFLEVTKLLIGINSNGSYHPNIVLFGDSLPTQAWALAEKTSKECDCMMIIGTSQLVHPASTLPSIAKKAGAKIIVVDPVFSDCDIWLHGTATESLSKLITLF